MTRINGGLVHERALARRPDALGLLAALVGEESTEGTHGIAACLDIVAKRVGGIAETIGRPVFDGVPAVVARFGKGDAGRRVTFAGHVDVVPASASGWRSPPFTLTERDGLLFGRGSCDMKGGVAATLEAILLVAALGVLDDVSVELVLTGDEEVGSERGMQALLGGDWITGRSAVCCEPTGLRVFLGNRGLVWMDVTIAGHGGHAGMAHALANPIDVVADLIAALRAIPLETEDARFDPATPSLTVTRVTGDGGARNVVPDQVEIAIDRRLLPGEDPGACIDQIERVIHATVRRPFTARASVIRRWPAYAITPDCPIAAGALHASNREPRFGMDSAANDSSWLDAAGIATVLLGPGEPTQAHAANEQVDPDEVMAAVEIYAQLMLQSARAGGPGAGSILAG